MKKIEEIVIEILREAPVNSPELMYWRDDIVSNSNNHWWTDEKTTPFSILERVRKDHTEWGKHSAFPPVNQEFAARMGTPNLRLARSEQQATYLLALSLVYYRRNEINSTEDKSADLLAPLKDFYLAIIQANRQFFSEVQALTTIK